MRFCAKFLLAGLVLLPLAARADDSKARQLFKQGAMEYRLANFDNALRHFQEALKLAYRPKIILNIAQCHRQLQHRRKALFYYKLYLTEWRRQQPARPIKYEADVRRRIAVLEARLKQQPGQPRPPAAPSRPATTPKPAPKPAVRLTAGPRPDPASLPASSPVKPATQATSPPAPDPPRSRTRAVVAWTALGLGAACAVAGGVLLGVGGVQGADAAEAYEAVTDPHQREAAWDDVAASNTKVITGYALVGLAAVGLGVSLYAFLTHAPAEQKPRAGVTLTAGPAAGGAAVLLQGSF